MESDHAPPAVKVKRTYGRKKDASTIPYGGPATTTSNLPSPHEKERNATPHDGDAEEIVGSPAPITNFGWKAKLEEINKQFKDDDNNDNNPADAFTAKANFTSVAGTPANGGRLFHNCQFLYLRCSAFPSVLASDARKLSHATEFQAQSQSRAGRNVY